MTEQYKLSQAAPVMPSTKEKEEKISYGRNAPVSSASIPSVYNKKLSKLFRGRLVALLGNTTVEEAIRKMARFNVSSTPVIQSKQDNTILGWVDMLDLLSFLCNLLGEGKNSSNISKEEIREKTPQFKNTKLSEVVGFAGKTPFQVMHGDESLADAIQYYLKGTHRIAISDDGGEIIGVISQWTIANYLDTVPTDDKEWIPSYTEPVKKHHFAKEVVCVNGNQPTLDCFLTMRNSKHTAVGVVDDAGKLIGNLSCTDLKGFYLFMNSFEELLKPVRDFLRIVREMQGRKENFVVACTLDTPIKDIVHRMNDEIIHRVYIVDEAFKPVGLFSLSDLMQDFVVDTHKVSTFAKPVQSKAM